MPPFGAWSAGGAHSQPNGPAIWSMSLKIKRRWFSLGAFVVLAAMPSLQQARGQQPTPSPLPGYEKAIAGQTLGYQSYSPLATMALLVRSTDGKSSIEWLTAPIPQNYTAATVAFRWIAGYAVGTSKADRYYDLSIDGRHVLTFTARHDPSIATWTVKGDGGVSLSFVKRWDDANGDRMGDMTLTVPITLFAPGKALDLTVAGKAAQSEDWYMTFEYTPGEWVQPAVQPALVRCASGLCQVVDLRVYHDGPPVRLSAHADDGVTFDMPVKDGFHNIELALPQVSKPTNVALHITMGAQIEKTEQVTLAPVAARTFYILHHSHMDVGYNLTQYAAIEQQMKNIRDALALARATRGYPPEARFAWNIESLWGVDVFLERATPAERREFVDAVRNGSMGIAANYANELTGIESGEELVHMTDYADSLRRAYGFRLDDAFFSDVPNFSWPVVTALVNDGVRYFSTGPNYIIGFAGHGDRVGATYVSADKPFWWSAPSGQGKILFWMTGRGYSSFHNGNLQGVFGPPPDHALKMRNVILAYEDELQAKGYAYEIAQLRYTYPADNSPVDPHLPDFVRDWNARYVEPKLVISTTERMFAAFVKRYGSSLPTHSGDLTPYWDDGALSSAREETMARRSEDRLEQATLLRAMLAPSSANPALAASAWRNLLMWSEHSWGADSSTSDPDSAFEATQWLFKRRFVLDAQRETDTLLANALGDRDGTWSTHFTVYNTCSWARSGLVVLGPLESTGGDTVADAGGRAVPSQRLHDGRLAFWASVPALGSTHYTVTSAQWMPRGDAHAMGTVLTAGSTRVEIDPKNGAIVSLTRNGREFADRSTLAGLNAYLYMSGLDPKNVTTNGAPEVAVTESGPLVAEVRIRSTAPGTLGLTRTIRLLAGSDAVEIEDTFDKTKVRDYESVHIAFPFAVPAATTRIDLGWGVMRPGVDQLPGSNADFYPVRRWVDVSNASDGVTLATPDAPLLEIGALNDERLNTEGYRSWRAQGQSSATIYSYVLNNYWHTNFRADQEGVMSFRYAILPHDGPYNALDAHRFGDDRAFSLIVAPTVAGDDASAPVNVAGGATITSIDREANGRVRVRVFNPQPQPIVATLHWKRGPVQRLALRGYELRTVPAFP